MNMFVNVIILGVCIACQIETGQAAELPSSNHNNVAQSNQTSAKNDSEWIPTLSGRNGSMERGESNKTNSIFGPIGTSNATQTSSGPHIICGLGGNNMFTDSHGIEQECPSNLIGGRTVDFPFLKGEIPSDQDGYFNNEDKAMSLKSLDKIWHVGIYYKQYTPYMQICGGTLVTTKAVISAAHCFWSKTEDAPVPARYYAVGAGKRNRPWNDFQDVNALKSDVAAIHMPVRYRDSATSYQEDIAVVLLAQEFRVNFAVKPACVDFDEDFDNEQLKEGNIGTILGWGLTEEDGKPSSVLNYLELPTVAIEKCLKSADKDFIRYLTSDKICAGDTGKAMCRGDSGGGLVFTEQAGPERVPYLRGVASTAPRGEHDCNAHALAALTHVRAHRDFLRRYIPGLEKECEKHFPTVQDRYEKYEEQPEKPTTCQPVQCTCNCFCNNQEPTHDEIVFRD